MTEMFEKSKRNKPTNNNPQGCDAIIISLLSVLWGLAANRAPTTLRNPSTQLIYINTSNHSQSFLSFQSPWRLPASGAFFFTGQNKKGRPASEGICKQIPPIKGPAKQSKAKHQTNDRAVMEAYGMWGKVHSEAECVAWLFKMYQELTEKAEGK